jgi:hypothetical protein
MYRTSRQCSGRNRSGTSDTGVMPAAGSVLVLPGCGNCPWATELRRRFRLTAGSRAGRKSQREARECVRPARCGTGGGLGDMIAPPREQPRLFPGNTFQALKHPGQLRLVVVRTVNG